MIKMMDKLGLGIFFCFEELDNWINILNKYNCFQILDNGQYKSVVFEKREIIKVSFIIVLDFE